MDKPATGKKGTKKKVPPVQHVPPVQNAQPVFPLFSATGPMNAASGPSASTSSGIPNTHQPQTPSHNLAPSLPAPQAVINPYGTPPPGVAALKPPAGMSSGIPYNQLAQAIGSKGVKKNIPSVQNQNVPAVFPLFSATGPMNTASGPSAGTSSGIPNNQQQAHQTLSHSLAPSLPAPQAIMNPYGAAPPGVAAPGQPPAGTASGMTTHHAAQTLSHSLAPPHPAPQAIMQPLEAAPTGVAAQGQPLAGTSSGIPTHQTAHQTPSHSLAPSHTLAPSAPAPAAETQPLGAPDPTGLTPYGMSAKTIRNLAKRLAHETPSPEPDPSRMRMQYPKPATAPETAEEHSIYPMNRQMRRDRGLDTEETLDTFIAQMDPGLGNGDPEFDLQRQVQKAVFQLWVDKGKPMAAPPARPASRVSETLDERRRDRSDRETSGGNPAPSQKGKETSTVPDESMVNWDGAKDLGEDVERDMTIFEDTPPDASLVPEREEWNLPPFNEPNEPIQPAPLTALYTLPTWDPSLDPDYQLEAQWNLEKWDDFRFKVPSTDSDRDSLQQALEITRMDFWIRNPYKGYPRVGHRAVDRGESYGSQHRRLQHAFCRLWREYDAEGGPAPELYRLPAWIFGFEARYWRPASWGMDKRSEVYHRGLSEMAAEKYAKGLQGLNYRNWKAKLEEQDRAVMAEAETPLGLFAGSR